VCSLPAGILLLQGLPKAALGRAQASVQGSAGTEGSTASLRLYTQQVANGFELRVRGCLLWDTGPLLAGLGSAWCVKQHGSSEEQAHWSESSRCWIQQLLDLRVAPPLLLLPLLPQCVPSLVACHLLLMLAGTFAALWYK